MMFLLGLAIILLGFGFFIILLGGNVSDFIDLAALLLIICAMLGVLTATQSFKLFYTGFKAVIFPKKPFSERELRQAVSLFRLLSKTALITSAIGVLIGLVNILRNVVFTSAEFYLSLGLNIAVSLISLFYGLLFVVAIFEPMIFILKKRLTKSRAQRKE